MQKIIGEEIQGINVVGGGIQDQFLCEMTAKTTGKEVIAGPIEAAVLGNFMIQAIAMEKIGSIKQGRELIYKSFNCKRYTNSNI